VRAKFAAEQFHARIAPNNAMTWNLPISAVRRSCREGQLRARRAERFPPTLPVNLYNQKSHLLSAAMCAMSESR
jgi:hypothetical protein